MGKILLFSRCELVHLYGSISKYLEKKDEVIHLAYSNKEEKILYNEYKISNVINFKKEISIIYNKEKLDNNLFQEIDNLIIENTQGRFCLNSAIQSDRTFQNLPYNECLKLSQVYYKFWNTIIFNNDIKYIIHEPNSLIFTQMASIVAKKYDALYLAQIQVVGENKFNWIFVEADIGFPIELFIYLSRKSINGINRSRVKEFLSTFRSKQGGLLPELTKKTKQHSNTYIHFLRDLLKLSVRHLKHMLDNLIAIKPDYIDHVELFFSNIDKSFCEAFQNKWDLFFNLKYDYFDSSKEYYYYPLHVEPEAVVLYWGDGFYKNQVKLIENIAAQLPVNCYLYVKDHPHGGDYRDYVDYKRIKNVPNVKLLNPNISGRSIISKSKGVITINGTSGFEAILLNKQVYTFGNSFYNLCKRVVQIKHIRDLQECIYNNYSKVYSDDNDLYSFINAYLNSIHQGFTVYFGNYTQRFNVEYKKNSEIIAKEMLKGLRLIESEKSKLKNELS